MLFHELTRQEVVLRILAAIFIGGLIGLERGMKNRPAGLRTYMLVCVGSCLVMMTNQYAFQYGGAGDPMRLGAQVISGIGFLGAGTIIVTRHNQIKGLTTAAGLWASAGLGLALGIGFYEGAITAGIGVYVILSIIQGIDYRVHKRIRFFEICVELDNSVSANEFLKEIRRLDLKIEDIQFEPEGNHESGSRAVILALRSKKMMDHRVLRDKIKEINGVIYLEEL